MEITAEIIASFRAAYPLFSDGAKWPDATVTTALCEGDVETGSTRWGSYEDDCHNFKHRGMFLYAAHWLVRTYPNGAADNTQQNPSAGGQVQSKTVGDESTTFAVTAYDGSSGAGNNWLASTQFGQQFMRLRKRAGMGAVAV